MIASMANYCPYIGAGLMHTIKVGKSNSTISVAFVYTGLRSPALSSYYKIIGLTNVLRRFTGCEPSIVGATSTSLSFITKYSSTMLPGVSSYKALLTSSYQPLGGKKATGVRPVSVISTNIVIVIKNTTGALLPRISGNTTNSRYISKVWPLRGSSGLNTVRVGAIANKFTDIFKYTGMRIGVVGIARLQLSNWKTTVVTQAQNVVQTLIQFWS